MGTVQIKHPKTGKIMNYAEGSLVHKAYLRNNPENIISKPATQPAPSQGTAPKPQTPVAQPAPSQGVTPNPQPAQPAPGTAPSTGGSSFVGFNPDAMKSYLDSLIPQIQVPVLQGTPYKPPTPSIVKAIKPATPQKKLDHIYTPGKSAEVDGYKDNQVVSNESLVRYLDSLLKGGF